MQALARNAQALLQLSVDGRYCFVNLTTAFCERSSGSSSPSASSWLGLGLGLGLSVRDLQALLRPPPVAASGGGGRVRHLVVVKRHAW